MTTHTVPKPVNPSVVRPYFGGAAFDCLFLVASTWFIVGAYADAWAHNHIPDLETFFTPWHAVLYSGFFVTALVLVGVVIFNKVNGASWARAIPNGYALSLLGVAGFVVGGLGDMFWHILFGVEQNVDAQFSPTHMFLIVCTCLFLAGPYRALYRRSDEAASGRYLLPLAVVLLFLVIGLITMLAHPFVFLWPSTTPSTDTTGQTLAVISFLFQSCILLGILLYTLRRWKLYPGFFTIVYLLNSIPLSLMQDHYSVIVIATLAGLLTDGLYFVVRPRVEEPTRFRLFAATAASGFYLVYFLVLWMTAGIVWSIHLSVGSIVTAGLVAWVLTYAFIPSRMPHMD